MGFFGYVRAAFNARPWGMWVAPNWVFVAAVGMVGWMEPGVWIVGAGVELGYLLMVGTNGRFQRVVDARERSEKKGGTREQVERQVGRLSAEDQGRYRALEQRCQQVLKEQHDATPVDLQMQADGLGKLVYVYLRLLLTRAGIVRVLGDAGGSGGAGKSIDVRMGEVEGQMKGAGSEALKRSLGEQLEILGERKKRQAEAREKLVFIEAELVRIQEQVELIREGLVVTSDPGALSRRIDTVGDSLGATTRWIKEQQELVGDTAELLGEESPVVLEVPE